MSIYIYKNNQQAGPFDENTILGWLRTGQLSSSDVACRQGANRWQTLGEMFPQAAQSAGFANLPIQPRIQPQQSGNSKMLRVGLLALGGVLLLAVIGVVALRMLPSKKASNLTTNQLAGTNVNAASPSPKPPALNAKDLQNKSKELAKMSPPQKIVKNPIIKGKVAIVDKTGESDAGIVGFDYDGLKYNGMAKSLYGFADAKLATRPEEIDTLVQILCSKGRLIGRYTNGAKAFGGTCKVTIVDYKTPSVIAQKSFVDNEPPSTITASSTSDVIAYPSTKVWEFIKSFPQS